MKRTAQRLLLLEAAVFFFAAAIHAGAIVPGYAHHEARIAETVIGIVLVAGLVLTWIRPAWLRAASLGAQGFALFLTLVGVLTIILGVGPRTVPDVIYHIAVVTLLVWGLSVARRIPRRSSTT